MNLKVTLPLKGENPNKVVAKILCFMEEIVFKKFYLLNTSNKGPFQSNFTSYSLL